MKQATVKFKLGDISVLYQALSNLNLKGVKVAYAVSKLKKLFEEQINTIRESVQYPSDWPEYVAKQMQIVKEYMDNENGIPINIEGTTVKIDKNKIEELSQRLNELAEQYKDLLEQKAKIDEELNQLLQQEVELSIVQLSIEELPDDIDVATMDVLVACKLIE